MKKAIGIDLGTTNTVVAVLQDGRPQVVEDDRGYRVLPSVLNFDKQGQEVVGHAARNRILTDPDRTVYAIKRLMGRRFDSEQAVEARGRVGYPIEPASDGGCMVVAAGRKLSPIEVSASILRTAREMAERALGQPVEDAVITVPAYFNHQQRSATLEAARLAGLNCDRLVNEPTAAALAYGFRRDVDRTLLVYDLGGGTFDVSVLHLSSGVYEILASKGDTYLGGEDFDYRLVDHLADQFMAKTKIDLRRDRMAMQRLKEAAERAKCELSFSDKTSVLVPRVSGEHSLEATISRLELERLVEDLVQRSIEVTRRSVTEAGLNLSDIDDVILVGGQTRMPRVREMISGLFGKEPSRGVHPEEVVAIGAAVHAATIVDDDAPVHVLIDLTPFDLGIDVAGGLFQTVVSRNTHIPATETRTFATSRENQTSVRITVRQGESRFADENEFLGEFRMEGLSPAPRMETKVEVTFRIDSSGMLHVSAMEPGVGEARKITVRNYAEVAQSRGAVQARVDGGQPRVASDDRDVPVSVSKKGKAAAPKKATEKKGLFASLLGGRSKPKDSKPAPAPPAEAPRPDPAPLVAAQIAELPPAPPADRRINLPAPTATDELEEFDTAALEAYEGELVDEMSVHPGGHSGREEQASIGLAGSSASAWATEEDAFALPSFDDEDEDDQPAPVGLAGGGFEPEVDHEIFALPEDFGEALDSLDEDDAGKEDDLFALDGDDLDLLGEDPFEELDVGLLAEIGVAMDEPSAPAASPAPGNDADETVQPLDEDEPLFLPPPEPVAESTKGGMGNLGFDDDASDRSIDPFMDSNLFSLPAALSERSAPQFDNDERTEIFARSPGPGASSSTSRHRRRKPARLKLAYRNIESMVGEYRENLRRGGCFVKTGKPLPVGRECVIEVRAPSMHEPLCISGVVTWSSVGLSTLPTGQDPGMGIEYRLDEIERAEIERVLSGLTG